MISVSEIVVNKFIDNDIINDEDKEIYVFGYNKLKRIALNIVTTLFIGYALNIPAESIVFLICTILIRTYSGGYHAKTPLKCYLSSVSLVTLSLLFIKFTDIPLFFYIIMMTISVYVLYKYAPSCGSVIGTAIFHMK